MVKQITSLEQLEKEFKEAGSKAVIVDFYATWCGPCKVIAPVLQTFSEKYPNVIVLKVDVDEAEDVSQKYQIEAMPTFKVFVNGKEEDMVLGASQDKVEALFKKYA